MQKGKQKYNRLTGVAAFITTLYLIFYAPALLAAPTYVSPNYGVDEVFMGSGGLNDAQSNSYRARASLGDTAVGNSSSSNYQAYGGFTTNTDPFIEMTVGGNIDLGYLNETETKAASATFTIRTYLASGYEIFNVSDPPKVTGTPGTHMLATNNTPTAPTIGTEQFGINLATNSSPEIIGADPVQLPDASYSFGQVDSDYATPDLYQYIKDDRIAFSNSTSGDTRFTVTYIYNISDITPAGTYIFHHKLVAVSTY